MSSLVALLRCSLVAVLSLILVLGTGVPTGVLPQRAVAQADGLEDLVEAFGASLKGLPAQQRKAALEVFRRYGDYKRAVASGGIDKALARQLDEQLVGMCQEAWRDVSVKYGSGLDHVVPVGTLGHRFTNSAYLPGKSDKDFIPRGAKASEAAQDFASTFRERFGIAPGSLDVNALDPTDPSRWPGRYAAASNIEKYNTVGGNKWLAAEEALQKPNLWRFDPAAGKMKEVFYESVVRTPPPALTKGDALGWFSDNSKFRSLLGESVTDPRSLVLRQAKYDLRNADAFRLAGGQLSEGDRALLSAAEMLRNGKTEAAIGRMMTITGEMDLDRALAAYLRGMDELTSSMGRHVADAHISLMARSLADSKATLRLSNELAASLANLPRAQRIAAVELLTERFGASKTDEIVRLANAFERRVTWGLTHFDDAAMASFGKRYDQLSDAERSILHGADEVAESFLGKAARVTGYVFSGYAIWSAYQQASRHGTAVAVGSAMGRAFIEAMQAGVPILAVAELVAQLTAGAVQLGASAYKNAVLEELYARYARDPGKLDFLLDIQSVVGWYSGGLRQLAIDLRMENPNLSEAQIRKVLADYFARRLVAERSAAEMTARIGKLVGWLTSEGIELLSTSDLAALTADDQARLAALLEAEMRLRDQLTRDGIPVTDEIILYLLWHLYHRAGTPESYEAALRSQYESYRKTWPPAGQPTACADRPVIKASRGATVSPARPPAAGGVLLSGGASFAAKPVDTPCDPAVSIGPVDVPSGGTVRVTLDGGPPVPNVWSLYNSGVSATISYTPVIGRNEGPSQTIAFLALSSDAPDDSDTHLEVIAELPGPGRLRGTIGAAAGSGPLTRGCFGQSGTVEVALVEPKGDEPARPSSRLAPGDRLIVGDNGTTTLLIPGFAAVRIRGSSNVVSGLDAPGADAAASGTCGAAGAGLSLERGGLRSRTLPGGAPLPVAVGGRTVTPRGTDLVVEATDEGGGRVLVLEGSAIVTDAAGATIEVVAGQQLTWPEGGLAVAELAPDDPSVDDPLFPLLPLDDGVPAPYGDAPTDLSGLAEPGGTPADWIWLDAGDDASFAITAPDSLTVTTPPGNELWGGDASAPRLLRKVSGDFDLEADLLLRTAASTRASAEFVIESPGSSIGALAGQMSADGPAADSHLLAGGWVRVHGGDELASRVCTDYWVLADRCPDADGEPVRVRLSRRGDLWTTYRRDGAAWIVTGQRRILVPETVWAGWVFKRTAYDGLVEEAATTSLSGVRLLSAPSGSLPPPAWDLVSEPVDWGSVEVLPAVPPLTAAEPLEMGDPTPPSVQDLPLRLALDGTAIGSVNAQSGRVLEGDFEVVVRVDARPWDPQEGEARQLIIQSLSLDEREQAIIGFHETPYHRIMSASVQVDGHSQEYKEAPLRRPVPRWLRLRRQDGRVVASFWSDCRWQDLVVSESEIHSPLYLRPLIGNQWHATVPAALEVVFHVERMADGPGLGQLEPWEPESCSVTSSAELPTGLVLPDGLTAEASLAPLPLGRVFFDPHGRAYAFLSHRDDTALLRLDPEGAKVAFEDIALAGLNRKSGLWLGDRLLIGVDGWSEGGNPYFGVLELDADGMFREWTRPPRLTGLSDLQPAPQGGLLVSDNESQNIFHVSGEATEAQPLISGGERLWGIIDLAVDDMGTIYALSVLSPPLNGPAGLFRLASDGTMRLLATPPAGSPNFGAVESSPGGVLEPGLYVTDPTAGILWAVTDQGSLQPVIEGLPGVTEMAFDPTSGELLLTWDEDKLLRVSRAGRG